MAKVISPKITYPSIIEKFLLYLFINPTHQQGVTQDQFNWFEFGVF